MLGSFLFREWGRLRSSALITGTPKFDTGELVNHFSNISMATIWIVTVMVMIWMVMAMAMVMMVMVAMVMIVMMVMVVMATAPAHRRALRTSGPATERKSYNLVWSQKYD